MGVQIAFDFGPPRATPVAPLSLAPSLCELQEQASRMLLARNLDSPLPAIETRMTRAALEAWLQRLCGVEFSLVLSDNERTMISTRRQAGRMVVRVHHMFLDADAHTLAALARYLNKSDSSASGVLFDFVKQHRDRIRKTSTRRMLLRSEGQHHGLQEIFERVNRTYFGGQVQARITWARQTRPQRRSRRSIKLGSYHSQQKLIRVHPVLDAGWVPEFFVAYIVYHEMLHQVVPPQSVAGRRDFHGPKFRVHERRFAEYDAAIAWERQHLDKLLRG